MSPTQPAHDTAPRSATTDKAREDTVLSPHFYTTDFAALDAMDMSSVREEWNGLIEELRAERAEEKRVAEAREN